MSEVEDVQEIVQNDSEPIETVEKPTEEEPEKNKTAFVKRSYKTKKEIDKEAKLRAIDNFKRGEIDPEFRVVKMPNGDFRCYKRKEPLAPEPIKLNQVPENKPRAQVEAEELTHQPSQKTKTKEHDPFADVIYYNLNTQISEQLNKRLDAVNQEIERLRRKNTKLKGKYKQLKQAIYITEEEDEHESAQQAQHEPPQPAPPQQQEPEPIQQQPPSPKLSFYPRRTTGINFNRFFQ